MATAWFVIGECLVETNKLSNAKECLEKALESEEQTSNDLNTENSVATTLQ